MNSPQSNPYRGQKAAGGEPLVISSSGYGDSLGRPGHPSIVHYTKRRKSIPGSGLLTTTLASKSEAVESVSIISRDPPHPHYHTLQVVETGFGGLIGPKGTRPKSVFVSGSLYTANGPLTLEGFSQVDSFSGGDGCGRPIPTPSPRPTSSSTNDPEFRNYSPHQEGNMTAKSYAPAGHPGPSGILRTCSPLPLQSTEDLTPSRCGSRQSLLESNSRRDSRVFYVPAVSHSNIQHQYTNVGCTASETLLQQQQQQQQQHQQQQHTETKFQKSSPQTSVVKNNHRPVGVNSKSDVEIRKQRDAIKKDLQKKMDLRWDKDTRSDRSRCNWSFVFDPAGRLCYYWSMIVSLAFLYNFWVIIFRFSFAEITWDTLVIWFSLDYFMDVIYLLDIVFHFRTGYLEDGVLQVDSTKLRLHYMNSTTFYVDCLCLLPLDFLYLSLGFKSILRIFRLVKVYQFWAFMDRSERHTNYPNVLRFVSLIHYLLLVFHWNACLFHLLYSSGFGIPRQSGWANDVFPVEGDSVQTYLMSLYWTILALTTIGDLPQPGTRSEYLYVIFELIVGLITFATVLGIIANIVTNVSAARKDFQAKLDGVKTYMRMRRVPNNIQNKVIKWFDYLWLTQKSSDEEKAVSCLPDKLKGEIAIHVHLDTLKRVEIFQNTEAGFLCELVLRLRPVLFSPGDYICRKGEVGKEMYICARGRLEVVVDNGKTVLATLKAGSYFGEISILNMGAAGNRRTASVRSVGYSDLFVLSKKDMWEVLKDYPAARVRLEAIAAKRLEKYKKAPLEKAALPRSTSTPGLVESIGKIPLEDMWVSPLPLYNTSEKTSPDSGSKARCRQTDSPTSEANLSSRSESTIDKAESQNGALAAGSANLQASPHRLQQYSYYGQQQQQPVATGGMASAASFKGSANADQSFRGSATFVVKSTQPYGVSGTQHQQQCFYPPQQQTQLHPQAVLHVAVPASQLNDIDRFNLSSGQSSYNNGAFGQIKSSTSISDVMASQQQQQQGSKNKEDMLHEIKRLRERIRGLESDNAALHLKMSRAQKDVDQRLTEIELQIGPDDDDDDDDSSTPSAAGGVGNTGNGLLESGNSGEDEADNNKESFI